MTSVDDAVLEIVGKDDFLKNFLAPSLNNVALEQAAQLLSVSEQINKLTEGISALDKELQKQVLENHEDLLFHASWIEKLEGVLEMMSVHMQFCRAGTIDIADFDIYEICCCNGEASFQVNFLKLKSLLSGVERISSKIVEPYQKMEKQNLIMENILKILNILRRVARIQVVTHRLPSHVTSDADIAKTSKNIQELDQLWSEIDLSDIKLLELNQRKLRSIKDEVSERAKVQLLNGIKKLKLSQISAAVQVFSDLNILVPVTKEFTNSSLKNIKKIIDDDLKSLLDLSKKGTPSSDISKRGPGKAAMPAMGNASSFRTRLWSALDEIFDTTYTSLMQIEILEAALLQNSDDFIGTKAHSYIEKFRPELRMITNDFWNSLNVYLGEQLVKCSRQSKFVKEALEGEYPRFLRLYMDLCKKLQASDKPENFSFHFTINKNVLAPFELAYLANLDSVVSYPVHNMFSTEGTPKAMPSTEDIDSLIRIIRSELSVALFDPNLSSTIARNITKSIGTFCNNCEQHIVVQGPDAVQVIGPRKAAQDRNIEIANRLEYLKIKLKNVTANLGKNIDAAEILNLSLVTYADSLITKIISTMLDSVVQAVRKIILTMHVEDFSREEEKESSISLYMRELTTFISRAYSTYLKPFESQDVLKKCCVDSGKHCMEYFLRHVALIRPLGAGGRIRLMADCSEFETAMNPLLGEEPKSYRILRLFKLMIPQSPQEILNNSAVGETIPYSLVLLFLFSYAPDEMKSPHESGVDPKIKSIETLSEYLDNHQLERDRIDLINRTLAKYCEGVRQVPGKNFDPVYGVMAHFIQRFRASV